MEQSTNSVLNDSTDTEKIASLPPSIASTWLIALRTAMVSVGLLSSTIAVFLSPSERPENVETLFTCFALLFFANAIIGLWAKFVEPTERFLIAQLCFDCAIVGGVIFATGGTTSPFVFLYLPLQMIAAIFLSSHQSKIIAWYASILYALLLLSYSQLWEAFGSSSQTTFAVSDFKLFLHWFGLSTALCLVHIGTSRVRSSLLTHVEVAELSKITAESLAKQLHILINGLPEAVLAVDKNNTIQAVNRTAEELFGSEIKKLINSSVDDLSQFLKDEFQLPEPLSTYEAWDELSFKPKSSPDEHLRVVLHKKSSSSEDKVFSGTYYLFQDVTRLRTIEEKLALQEQMARSLASREDHESSPIKLAGFVGESPLMKKLFHLITRVATSDATIHISGESGTGKELVARAIHLQGPRADRPFIPVNCGAIPESLMESELFGHKKGSFTGAIADHKGLFAEADGGTIFLDEIGEMPLAMQAKLLRTIQDKAIRPVGGNDEQPVEVRIIAATNRDLKEEVKNGNFREDLFYRLNVIHIQLPPLRERKEDIPLLIDSIVRRMSKDQNIPIIPAQTLEYLMNYHYPGNVRELENILERALVLSGEAIVPEHLPEHVRNNRNEHRQEGRKPTEIIERDDIVLPIQLDDLLSTIEQHYLIVALEESKGVKKQAAELLGMNFRSFRYRLQKFNM